MRELVDTSEKKYTIAILFNISEVFDNVWWTLVLMGLKKRDYPKNIYKVMQSYFHNRQVKITYGDTTILNNATRSCPQGSVLSPTCWNI